MAVSHPEPLSRQVEDDAKRFASQLISAWPSERPLDACAMLARHPHLADVRSVVLDLANEEYCQRIERGETIAPRQFARRFPRHERSVLRLVQLHGLFEGDETLEKSWPVAGDSFAGFLLTEEIGRGAFSRVFLAAESAVGHRTVVVKICRRGDAEAAYLGRLDHPGIVPVLSAGRVPGGWQYLCMPDLGRTTLADLIENALGESTPSSETQRMPPVLPGPHVLLPPRLPVSSMPASYIDEIMALALDLAEALAYAHSRGIRHGDLKPTNILIRPDGRAMLLDFNLASSDGPPRPGGTLAYMAPEALHCFARESQAAAPDARSDLFSLGVTLYQALAGRLPFEGESTIAAQLESRSHGFPPLADLNPLVDRRRAALIERCLAFDPAARPQSADELAAALRADQSAARRTSRWIRLHRRESLGVLASCVVGLAGGGFWWARRDPYVVRQLELGRRSLSQADYTAAIDCYGRVLERDPTDAQALFERARCYVHRQQFVAAGEDFRRCADVTNDGRANAGLAYCLLRVNDYFSNGVVYGLRACEQGFTTAEVYSNLGYCHLMLGAFELARTQCEAALRLRSRFPAATHTLALADLKQSVQLPRRPPDLQLIERALALCPPSAELQLDAACIYCQAARCTKPRDRREQYIHKAFSHLRTARHRGLAAEPLAAILKILPELESDPRFEQIRAMPLAAAAAPSPEPLADPLLGRDKF